MEVSRASVSMATRVTGSMGTAVTTRPSTGAGPSNTSTTRDSRRLKKSENTREHTLPLQELVPALRPRPWAGSRSRKAEVRSDYSRTRVPLRLLLSRRRAWPQVDGACGCRAELEDEARCCSSVEGDNQELCHENAALVDPRVRGQGRASDLEDGPRAGDQVLSG